MTLKMCQNQQKDINKNNNDLKKNPKIKLNNNQGSSNPPYSVYIEYNLLYG